MLYDLTRYGLREETTDAVRKINVRYDELVRIECRLFKYLNFRTTLFIHYLEEIFFHTVSFISLETFTQNRNTY